MLSLGLSLLVMGHGGALQRCGGAASSCSAMPSKWLVGSGGGSLVVLLQRTKTRMKETTNLTMLSLLPEKSLSTVTCF